MLSMRPCQRCTNAAVNRRMNPARQIRSMLYRFSADSSAVSNAARSSPNGLLSMVTAGTPLALALASPPASARFEITTAISAGKSFVAAASIKAAILDPRPEIRIATRRFMASPCQIEVAVIDDAMLARGRNHLAQKGYAFAGFGQDIGDLLDRLGLDDGDHADAAIERAQQFEFGNAALLRQPLEDRQHRKARQIDPDAQMPRQHAGNIVGETAAGDVGESLDSPGLVDGAQARSDIEPGRGQQRPAECHDRRKRRLRLETKTRAFDNLADQ